MMEGLLIVINSNISPIFTGISNANLNGRGYSGFGRVSIVTCNKLVSQLGQLKCQLAYLELYWLKTIFFLIEYFPTKVYRIKQRLVFHQFYVDLK